MAFSGQVPRTGMEAVPPRAYNTNYGGRRERVAQASSAHSFRGDGWARGVLGAQPQREFLARAHYREGRPRFQV
jgi:hypothetical protein